MLIRLLVDPGSADTLYAGVGSDPAFGSPAGAVFVSHDAGASWTASGSGLPASFSLTDLTLVAPGDGSPTRLYAATADHGLFRSDDAGTSWQLYNSGLADPRIVTVAVDPARPGTVYAGIESDGGLFVHNAL